MYQSFSPRGRSNFRSRSGGGGSFPKRFAPAGRRGGFNQKTVDVRLLINKVNQAPVVVQEYQTKHAFADFQIVELLKSNIASKGFVTPTPIQDQVIPSILEGHDVIGIANTGTGKTAAFLLPLIHKIYNNPQEQVLIVTPTRELAFQILEELQEFSRGMNISSVLCIGGSNMFRQTERLRRHPQFVIGTPGRILDHIERRSLQLYSFRNVVLDEVDRMVDIGFIKDITRIVSLLPTDRQSLFFSATIDNRTRDIMHTFLRNPITVTAKTADTVENIEQDIIQVRSNEKVDKLHDLLTQDGFDKVMIFGRTKWGVQKLTDELIHRGFKATALHGNKSQGQRKSALDQFKRSEVQVLLATDVASRGIDIDDVTHVINYDLPATYEDYIHRIGRTGRANKRGKALTFVD